MTFPACAGFDSLILHDFNNTSPFLTSGLNTCFYIKSWCGSPLNMVVCFRVCSFVWCSIPLWHAFGVYARVCVCLYICHPVACRLSEHSSGAAVPCGTALRAPLPGARTPRHPKHFPGSSPTPRLSRNHHPCTSHIPSSSPALLPRPSA